MKIKVEIDSMNLVSIEDIAEMIAPSEGWKLISVENNSVGIYQEKDSGDCHGSEEYRVDLLTGKTEIKDEDGEWEEYTQTSCPFKDGWEEITWVTSEDGKVYAVS